MAKPIKTLEFHYSIIQFLLIMNYQLKLKRFLFLRGDLELWKSPKANVRPQKRNRSSTSEPRTRSSLLEIVRTESCFYALPWTLAYNSQVVFGGVAGIGYMGDIAIDDIMVFKNESCALKPPHAKPRPPRPTQVPNPPGMLANNHCFFQLAYCMT